MPYKVPLLTSAAVTCDGSGNGVTPSLSPGRYGLTWEIHLIIVQNDSVTNQSQAFVYLNGISPTMQIGGTWSGNMDTDDTELVLQHSDSLFCKWTGADPNSHSILTISGYVQDMRFRL